MEPHNEEPLQPVDTRTHEKKRSFFRLPKLANRWRRAQEPQNELVESASERPRYASIAQIIDTALTALGDPNMSEQEKRDTVVGAVAKPEVIAFLGHEANLFIDDDTYTFDPPNVPWRRIMPLKDGTPLIENILGRRDRRDPLLSSHLQRQFPRLIIDPLTDKQAYLQAKGLTSEQSRYVESYYQRIQVEERAAAALQEYVGEDVTTSLFSFDGSSATVFIDDAEQIVYKVYHFGEGTPAEDEDIRDNYMRVARKEVDNLKVFMESGISPRFISSNVDSQNITTPIVVMEKIDTKPLEQVDPATLQAEKLRLVAIIHNLDYETVDTELVWDIHRDCLRVIDMAGFSKNDGRETKDKLRSTFLREFKLTEE